jgi:hypothetical protein
MNIASNLTIYASITKELDEELVLLGSEALYKCKLDFADREHYLYRCVLTKIWVQTGVENHAYAPLVAQFQL